MRARNVTVGNYLWLRAGQDAVGLESMQPPGDDGRVATEGHVVCKLLQDLKLIQVRQVLLQQQTTSHCLSHQASSY